MSRLGISIASLFMLVLLVYMPVWMSETDSTTGQPEEDVPVGLDGESVLRGNQVQARGDVQLKKVHS